MRRTRFITIMLFLIVFILVAALLVSVYYVFFSDDSGFLPFFSETKEENTQKEVIEVTKKYTRKISGTEFNAEVYADGTMGISIYTEGEVASKMKNASKLTGNIDKVDIEDVEFAYEVIAGKEKETTFIVIKDNGTVYYLDLDNLYINGKVILKQIEGLEDIIRIYETGIITDVEGYAHPYNVIAVDSKGREYIITNNILSRGYLPIPTPTEN